MSRNARAGSIPALGTFKKIIYIYHKQTNLLIMKKVTMIFAAVALAFAVASCGSKTTEEAAAVDSAAVVGADSVAVDSAAVVADSAAVEAAL